MRRWNGWGDDTIRYPLSERALAFLRETVGEGAPPRDVHGRCIDDNAGHAPRTITGRIDQRRRVAALAPRARPELA